MYSVNQSYGADEHWSQEYMDSCHLTAISDCYPASVRISEVCIFSFVFSKYSCSNLVCGPILTLKMSILGMIETTPDLGFGAFHRRYSFGRLPWRLWHRYRRGCGACLPKFLMIESADFHRLIGSFCSGYLGS